MSIIDSSSSSPLQNPTSPALRPAKSAAFKRESRRKRKERKRQEKLQLLLDDWAPLTDQHRSAAPPSVTAVSTAEWPSEQLTDQNREFIGWNLNPALALPAAFPPPLALPGDSAQKNALRLCREFFSTEDGSDEEDGEDEDSSDGKGYHFFKELFDTEEELMDYYRKDRERSHFYCLVCGGIGEKMGKKFISLVALVQHANFISKTKRIMAHRAYGKVVCELLGLEIDGLKGVYLENTAIDMQTQVSNRQFLMKDDMEEGDNNLEEVA